jgi:hypothetical protein
MDAASFDALFDTFTDSVFRLETLQHYSVSAEDARFKAFREGTARPERSVRTSPWLRRIAVSTAEGKSWSRVHLVTHPLSEYLRYELVSYVESQAAGEQIGIVDLDAQAGLDLMKTDYWLFDGDTDHARVVLMNYGADGRLINRELKTSASWVTRAELFRDDLAEVALPLNVYLAQARVA